MDLNSVSHKITRISIYAILVYVALINMLKNTEKNILIRLILLLVLAFMIIDCICPNIDYE